MHYNINQGGNKTLLHKTNANIIYEKFESHGLITLLNRTGLCVSYKEIKKHRNNLAKLTILNSKSNRITMPNHFVPNQFTLGALDNFNHSDNSFQDFLVAMVHTTITLRQTKPKENTTITSEVNFQNIKPISKLLCQEVTDFQSSKTIILPDSFDVSGDFYPTVSEYKKHHDTEFIISPIKSGFSYSNVLDVIQIWAAIKSLISDSNKPLMQVSFLPFIPKSVIKHATVYTARLTLSRTIVSKINANIL